MGRHLRSAEPKWGIANSSAGLLGGRGCDKPCNQRLERNSILSATAPASAAAATDPAGDAAAELLLRPVVPSVGNAAHLSIVYFDIFRIAGLEIVNLNLFPSWPCDAT